MSEHQILMRSDTAANWTSANPTLAAGEIGYETDTAFYKIGDGVTLWNSLGYTKSYTPIEKTLFDAKGDLLVGTADNTAARLPVGADDAVLTANSATSTGLEWAQLNLSPVFKTTSVDYTLAPYDMSATISFTAGGTLTVSAGDPAGSSVRIVRATTDNVRFDEAAGATVIPGYRQMAKPWSFVRLINVDSDTWVIQGDVEPITYEVGDTGPTGGFIFATPDSERTDGSGLPLGDFYYETCNRDFNARSWGGRQNTLADGLDLGDGPANTQAIIDAFGSTLYNGQTTAAYYAANLNFNGVSDWFLPSFRALLRLMSIAYNNPNPVINFLSTTNTYWSSTEYQNSVDYAFSVSYAPWLPNGFPYNTVIDDKKSASRLVLPIRRFLIPDGTNGVGVFGSGIVTNTWQSVDSFSIPTLGNATSFATLTPNGGWNGAAGNRLHAYFGGGDPVDRFAFSTGGNASEWGSLFQPTNQISAGSNEVRGIWAGGTAGFYSPTIQYMNLVTSGNGSDFGDLPYGIPSPGVAGNDTRILIAGEYSTNSGSNVNINYVTIATTGNSASFGDLTNARYEIGAASNTKRTVFAGGAPTINTIDFVEIATTGNAVNFGNLVRDKDGMAGTCSHIRALFAGGNYQEIDYIAFDTTGNAADFGDLPVARDYPAGTSNGHGGIAV